MVPFGAGVTSAMGLLIADAVFDLARTLVVRLDEAPWDRVNRLFADMEAEGAAHLRETGLQGEWRVTRAAEVRYLGQGHELDVPVPAGPLGPAALEAIRRAHAEVYAARYGYAEAPGAPLEATNWKLTVLCVTPKIDLTRHRPAAVGAGGAAQKGERRVYFPEAGGTIACPVFDRYRLGPGMVVAGPAVIEERETTVILLPGDLARVDEYASLMIDIAGHGA